MKFLKHNVNPSPLYFNIITEWVMQYISFLCAESTQGRLFHSSHSSKIKLLPRKVNPFGLRFHKITMGTKSEHNEYSNIFDFLNNLQWFYSDWKIFGLSTNMINIFRFSFICSKLLQLYSGIHSI